MDRDEVKIRKVSNGYVVGYIQTFSYVEKVFLTLDEVVDFLSSFFDEVLGCSSN